MDRNGRHKPNALNLGPSGAGLSRLHDIYHHYFDVLPVTSTEQLEAVYRLRYQVYCEENPFEDPAEHPNGMEYDEFDRHSVHVLLMHRPTGAVAGTVRLVLGDKHEPHLLPIEQVCQDPMLSSSVLFPRNVVAEVSRFAVSKQFRRRLGEGSSPSAAGENETIRAEHSKRLIPHITLGLIQGLVEMSRDNGVERWCAVMEPSLLRLLNRLGIHFNPIGPLVDYHGERQPCYVNLESMLNDVHAERADVWELITADGRLA